MVLKMKGVQVNTIEEDIIEEEGGEGREFWREEAWGSVGKRWERALGKGREGVARNKVACCGDTTLARVC